MSLILDALKQAERENRSRKTPDLSVVYQESGTRERRFSVWFWVVVALLANALVVTLIFWPGPDLDRVAPEGAARIVADAPATGISEQDAASHGGEASVPGGPGRVPRTVAEDGESPGRLESAEPDQVPEVPVPSQPMALGGIEARSGEEQAGPDEDASGSGPPPPETIPEPETASAGDGEEGPSAGSGSVPLLEELPPQTRAPLAAIRISGHVYDEDPARSFVFVDGQSLRIGDRIGRDGPVLEAITRDGVILDYGEGKAHVIIAP